MHNILTIINNSNSVGEADSAFSFTKSSLLSGPSPNGTEPHVSTQLCQTFLQKCLQNFLNYVPI